MFAEGSQVKLAGLALSDTEVVPLFLSLLKGISPEAGNGGAAANGSPAAEPGK
jgi:hypothetical protein